MARNIWISVIDELRIQGGRLRPVSANDLSSFEAETKLALPFSYREFCLLFGPGVIAPPFRYRICVPGPATLTGMEEIRKFNGLVREWNNEASEYCPNVAQYHRSWFFGTDIGTSYYFWDPLDITDPEKHEYGVYILYRDYQIERLTDTFWEFINSICLGRGIPGYANEDAPQKVFLPNG